MPVSNLAKVFGPTIVGYSSADPDQHAIFTETIIQASVSSRNVFQFTLQTQPVGIHVTYYVDILI